MKRIYVGYRYESGTNANTPKVAFTSLKLAKQWCKKNEKKDVYHLYDYEEVELIEE